MDKKQQKLFLEILERFQNKDILKSMVLIGSWCVPLYKQHFDDLKNISTLRTRDVDFLVPLTSKFKEKVDVCELLEGLGFETDFVGSEGYIRLVHPDLVLEFLVPQKGGESRKPYKLPKLGINAQSLPFMNLLTEETIQAEIGEIKVVLPHPVNFALHKLLISTRRSGANKEEKSAKDIQISREILVALIDAKEIVPIKGIFNSFHKNWKKIILSVLKEKDEIEIINVLKDE
jgi:nucleotidyltransferase-like protein